MKAIIQKLLALGRAIGSIKALLFAIGLLPAILSYIMAAYEGIPWAMRIALTTFSLAAGLEIIRLCIWLYETLFPTKYPVPVIDIFRTAKKKGWKFGGDSLDILDLVDALQQSGLNGELIFWGRPDRNTFEQLTRNEPLNEIPKDHWKDCTINWPNAFIWDNGRLTKIAEDGFHVFSYSKRNKDMKGYKDLHISGISSKWLKESAKRYRGKRAIQENERKMSWDKIQAQLE